METMCHQNREVENQCGERKDQMEKIDQFRRGGAKRKERKKWRKSSFYWFSSVQTARVRHSRSELDCAPRGRGSLQLWLVLV